MRIRRKIPRARRFRLDCRGNVLGRHRGIARYTVGQRRGLGISFGEALYVCKTDHVSNTVTLGREEELYSKTLTADNINLIVCESIERPVRLSAKIRYGQKERSATVVPSGDGRADRHIRRAAARRLCGSGARFV